MCTGIEIALIAGTVLSAAAATTATIAQSNAQARAGRDRAKLFTRQAERRRQEATVESDDFRRRNRRILAAQRAGFAAAGVQPQGTPIGVGVDTAKEIELTSQRILAAGITDATSLDISSGFERRGARAAQSAGFLKAGSTLLSGSVRAGSIPKR